MDSNSQFIPDGMNMIERLAKRFFDCIIALSCIIVFSPLFLIIYLMVKSDGYLQTGTHRKIRTSVYHI